MNERVKLLRKTLNLSGEKFGEYLGLTKMAISKMETARTGVTEQTIKSICREFNVNEDWLRNGNGDMFISVNELSLDEIIKSDDLSELEVQILKNYFSLDKKTRQNALEYCKKLFTS